MCCDVYFGPWKFRTDSENERLECIWIEGFQQYCRTMYRHPSRSKYVQKDLEFFLNTVKPLYSGHHRDLKKVSERGVRYIEVLAKSAYFASKIVILLQKPAMGC